MLSKCSTLVNSGRSPDLISILVGVNDTWHEFIHQNGVEPDRYKKIYRLLLSYTRECLPDVQLVLCEPFVAECGVGTKAWLAEIQQRQQIVKELAQDFDAYFVPFQTALDKVIQMGEPEYWLSEGVPPTLVGHQVLAECWIENVER